MKRVMVVAPHADDETLGCGGALFRHRGEGDKLAWVLVTQMGQAYSASKKAERDKEIRAVTKDYGFSKVYSLGFECASLDRVAKSKLIAALSGVFQDFRPQLLYVPFSGDAHSDHKASFEACAAAAKSFRLESLEEFLVYETLSETGHSLGIKNAFNPNYFVDISRYLSKKINTMRRYKGEIKPFPFPRSEKTIRALAEYRGSLCARKAAEAFCLLKGVR